MNLITTKKELIIVIFSIIGIVLSVLSYTAIGSSDISFIYLQLIIFFIFVTLYALKLKIVIYYNFIFVVYFFLTNSVIFAMFLGFIIFQQIQRWNMLSSITDSRKVSIRYGSFEALQRYAMFFMIFIVINLVFTFIYTSNLAAVFSIVNILLVTSSAALLISIYMSLEMYIESIYFYLITVISQFSLILYLFNGNINNLLLFIAPYIVMIMVIFVYYTMHRKA